MNYLHYEFDLTGDDVVEVTLDKLMEAPPASLHISIDGPKDVHDQLRMVDGTFEKAQAGLEKLREIKRHKFGPVRKRGAGPQSGRFSGSGEALFSRRSSRWADRC